MNALHWTGQFARFIQIGEISRRVAYVVMTTFYDVPANFLIPALGEQLKSNASIQMPEWADVVKTGSQEASSDPS